MGHALDMILEYIFADPLSNSCPNVSYCDAQLGPSFAGSSASSVASQLHTGIIPNHPSFAMLRNSLRFCGYTETAIEEIVAAVYTLASYGFLALPEGGTDGNTHPSSLAAVLGMGTAAGSQPYPGGTSVSSSTADSNTTVASTSLPTSANYAMTVSAYTNDCANTNMSYGTYQAMMNSSPANFGTDQYYGHVAYNPSNYSTSFQPPPPPTSTKVPHDAYTTTHSFEVGEHIVGALLGPGGRSIVDLQTWSGATVEVSKKGIYAPGTRNRIVKVSGSALAVQSATYFIKQCIDHEEMRRATQQPTVGHTDMSLTS